MPTPTATLAPVVPTITGSPALDAFLRNALTGVAAAITAVIVTWLNSKGFNDPNLTLMISAALFAGLCALASAVWAYIQKNKTIKAMADHVVEAAATGIVPENVAAVATKPAP